MLIDVPSRKEVMASLTDDAGNVDSVQVHAQPGEVMIPKKVQEDHPELMRAIYSAMADSGMNPERSVVGQGHVNPYTGQYQHGFFDFIKDILPMAGAALGGIVAGPVGAGIGSAGGTLLAGGDVKDAALSGIGTYAGAELLGPELGIEGTVGDALGSGGIGSSIASALPDAVLGASAGSVVGGFLGQQLGGMVAQAIDPPEPEETATDPINVYSRDIPNAGATDVPIPEQPDLETPNPLDTPFSSGPSINTGGVKYLYDVKDRNTGLTRTISSDDSAFARRLGTDPRRKKLLGGAITA